MISSETLKFQIIRLLDQLSPESLEMLRSFAEFLRIHAEQSVSRPRIVKLGGLWTGTPEITEADITEARREMWGRFGDRGL